jgi:hypothetical protein
MPFGFPSERAFSFTGIPNSSRARQLLPIVSLQSTYRLFESVVGVSGTDGAVVTMPAGSIVRLPTPRVPNIGMIDVAWEGKIITVAFIDIEIRAKLEREDDYDV